MTAPVAVIQRGRQLVAEYVQLQYTSGHLALIGYVRTLPRDARALTRFGLLLVGAAIVATPLLAAYAPRLGGVAFLDVRGGERTVSVPALVLALAVFSVVWGYLLTALAQGPGVVWIFVGLRYAFGMLAVGLAAGRSYWHLIPVALPVVIGAMAAGDRTERGSWRGLSAWGNIALTVLLAGVAIRVSPLPDGIRAVWYLYCPPVAAPFIVLHMAVARSLRVPVHGRAPGRGTGDPGVPWHDVERGRGSGLHPLVPHHARQPDLLATNRLVRASSPGTTSLGRSLVTRER